MNLSVLTNRQNFVSCRFVSSCQLNPCLINSKFVNEFVGIDKPTKFVSCRFVDSCQLNSRLIKSKVVTETKRIYNISGPKSGRGRFGNLGSQSLTREFLKQCLTEKQKDYL